MEAIVGLYSLENPGVDGVVADKHGFFTIGSLLDVDDVAGNYLTGIFLNKDCRLTSVSGPHSARFARAFATRLSNSHSAIAYTFVHRGPSLPLPGEELIRGEQ